MGMTITLQTNREYSFGTSNETLFRFGYTIFSITGMSVSLPYARIIPHRKIKYNRKTHEIGKSIR